MLPIFTKKEQELFCYYFGMQPPLQVPLTGKQSPALHLTYTDWPNNPSVMILCAFKHLIILQCLHL